MDQSLTLDRLFMTCGRFNENFGLYWMHTKHPHTQNYYKNCPKVWIRVNTFVQFYEIMNHQHYRSHVHVDISSTWLMKPFHNLLVELD